MKIKVINPNTTQSMTDSIGDAARSVARSGTEILAVSPSFGPVSIESYYDEYVAATGVLDEVRKGDTEENIDAYVIACYGDPGLHAARELTDKPVIGIAEASLYMASMLAGRFAIVTVIPRIHMMLEEMVRGYGMSEKCPDIYCTPIYVLDIEENPVSSIEKLRNEVRRAANLPVAGLKVRTTLASPLLRVYRLLQIAGGAVARSLATRLLRNTLRT